MSGAARGPTAEVRPGRSHPLGATIGGSTINFALRAPATTAAWLGLVDEQGSVTSRIALDPRTQRTGDVWHVAVEGLSRPVRYGWFLDGPNDTHHRFDRDRLCLDPRGREVGGAAAWGETAATRHSVLREPSALAIAASPYLGPTERVIYELGVRAFTRHPSAGVASPGTLAGLEERIPWLVELGVTTVELLPLAEWDENEVAFEAPDGRSLRNLWGYSPLSFFAPKASLAAGPSPVAEMRRLVGALHRAGIELIVDVVFNHTGERRVRSSDPAFAFQGVDRPGIYRLDCEGLSLDVTGCGNTVRASHEPTAELVLDALAWWHQELGVDGFRFDLAAALAYDEAGAIDSAGGLVTRIASDPRLERAVLIAEPWDAGRSYLPGRFGAWGRWSEWNDGFRDAVRRFVAGVPGTTRQLADALAGSPSRFSKAPSDGVNFVTCHDGFTLADLVTYESKRNEANGESNRDGSGANHAWNCGVEGPTDDLAVEALRRRQQRNLLTLLMVARGVPMILAGDEIGRSQAGNNNAYCQDNEVGWIDWSRADRDLFRFGRRLIALRRGSPLLRRDRFLPLDDGGGDQSVWNGVRLGAPDWSRHARCLAVDLRGDEESDRFYLLANAGRVSVVFELPALVAEESWGVVIDTAAAPPREIADSGSWTSIVRDRVELGPHSVQLLRVVMEERNG